MRLGQLRFQLNRPAMVLLGLVELLSIDAQHAEIDVGFGIVRTHSQGSPHRLFRFGVSLLQAKRVAEMIVIGRRIRPQQGRVAIALDRLARLVPLQVDVGDIAVNLRRPGSQRERRLKEHQRRVPVAERGEEDAEVVVGLVRAWIEREGAPVAVHGAFEIARLLQRRAKMQVRLGSIRFRLNCRSRWHRSDQDIFTDRCNPGFSARTFFRQEKVHKAKLLRSQ
jgi:hypothetical protein